MMENKITINGRELTLDQIDGISVISKFMYVMPGFPTRYKIVVRIKNESNVHLYFPDLEQASSEHHRIDAFLAGKTPKISGMIKRSPRK